MAYEIVNGPSGAGVDDFYGTESDAKETVSINPDGTYALQDLRNGGLRASKYLAVSLGVRPVSDSRPIYLDRAGRPNRRCTRGLATKQ